VADRKRRKEKHARIDRAYPTDKNARYVESTREEDDRRVSWRFGDADLSGLWSWTAGHIGADAFEVMAFLAEMDKLTWAEAQQGWRPKAKRVEAAGICAEAQDCLRRLGLEVEYLHEWHLTGLKRIWGTREGHVCHVLWWDPAHTVWPADPD
jgi:hypothetical protein